MRGRAPRFGTRRNVVRGFSSTPFAPPTTYTTNYPLTENPVSEGGKWIQGGTTGLDWTNTRSSGGLAFASTINTGFNDNVAYLNPALFAVPTNHTVVITVHRVAGYTPPDTHEIEIFLRALGSAHSWRGYEVDFAFANSGLVQLVRWDGALNNFTVLSITVNNGANIADGDTLTASITGSTITAKHNNNLLFTATDATYATGNAGHGFFVRTGGTPSSFCISQFSAS
jgi:hypothetical protein